MRYSWRWFGPKDPITISEIRQTGATDIVSALHHIPNGEVWSSEEIKLRQQQIAWDQENNQASNLCWSIVESVPVHEDIKKRQGNFSHYIHNYQQTLRNLASCGIKTVIYNFMPIIDWTRTDLAYTLPNGVKALRFDYYEYIAFDVFILQRPHARNDYSTQELAIAKQIADQLSIEQQQRLTKNIIAGLPGAEESFSLEQFRHALAEYQHIDANQLRNNLFAFLAEVLPVAEELGICLAIHPDDPPRQLFGLPRIVSTQQDLQLLIDKFGNYSSCGLNICAGSLGARADNDLALFLQLWGDRIPFVHLRSVKREANGSFYEDEHIAGSTNLAYLVQTILQLETRLDKEIIIRPDHGHQMLDDLRKQTNPGYSCIGRMKGIAELKGMELAIRSLGLSN